MCSDHRRYRGALVASGQYTLEAFISLYSACSLQYMQSRLHTVGHMLHRDQSNTHELQSLQKAYSLQTTLFLAVKDKIAEKIPGLDASHEVNKVNSVLPR